MTAEEAFETYHRAIFGFVYRRTQCTETAEDITQECFLVLLGAPARFDKTRGSLKTYLFAIARNLTLKAWRDGRFEVPLEQEQALKSADSSSMLEVFAIVERAVAALPALQQEALILFEYEGLSLEEISYVVDADVGTVKSRLYRARALLTRTLAPYKNAGELHGRV